MLLRSMTADVRSKSFIFRIFCRVPPLKHDDEVNTWFEKHPRYFSTPMLTSNQNEKTSKVCVPVDEIY